MTLVMKTIAGIAICGCLALVWVARPQSVDAASQSDGATSNVSTTEHNNWSLVWSDEFESDALDRTKWEPEISCWGGGNDERQCYVDSDENIRLDNGVLRLIAQKKSHTGPRFPQGMTGVPDETQSKDYTSGKLRTRGLAAFKYGRVSARMKLPQGQGTWPAFWMMPEDDVYGSWPLSGEIDIMEAVNLETPCAECPNGIERRTSAALHFGAPAPDNAYLFARADGTSTIGPSGEWREYAVEWSEDTIQWFVDGEIFMRLDSETWFTSSGAAEGRAFAPFDQSFHIAVNLAVGGNLAEKSNGKGFDPSSFPAELLVDWVRVEQCAADPDTGRACMSNAEWTGTPLGPWEVQAR